MAMTVLKVSQLNRFVKSLLDSTTQLGELYVKGELSNLSPSRTGHIYFTLKDKDSSVRAVMFSQHSELLKFMPQDGMAVLARGHATLYERDGSFSLYVSELMPDGAGVVDLALQQLRNKLERDGLFADSRKRSLPYFPQTIGVVTSEAGAAIHDIITTIERRCPVVRLIFAPAQVQGIQAAESIQRAIERLNLDGRSEVIIVGRGGGSAEDLWAFNEEKTVRAVAASRIPIISAVGHENDICLCDMAADLRAATPTAAAELAIPEYIQLSTRLNNVESALKMWGKQSLSQRRETLLTLEQHPAIKNKEFFIDINRHKVNNLLQSLYNHASTAVSSRRERLGYCAGLLDSVSPLKVLGRGYSITRQGGRVIKDSGELRTGDEITTVFEKGSICSTVVRQLP